MDTIQYFITKTYPISNTYRFPQPFVRKLIVSLEKQMIRNDKEHECIIVISALVFLMQSVCMQISVEID